MQFDDYSLLYIVQEEPDGHRALEEAVRIWNDPERGHEWLGRPEFEHTLEPGTRMIRKPSKLSFPQAPGGGFDVDGHAVAARVHRDRHRLRHRRRLAPRHVPGPARRAVPRVRPGGARVVGLVRHRRPRRAVRDEHRRRRVRPARARLLRPVPEVRPRVARRRAGQSSSMRSSSSTTTSHRWLHSPHRYTSTSPASQRHLGIERLRRGARVPPHSMQSMRSLIGHARPPRKRFGSVSTSYSLGPPGREEREQLEPVAALVEIEVGDEHRGLGARRLHEHAAVRIADERRAVERHRALGADAVGHDHEGAVRDAVGADHLLPQRLGVEVGMIGLGADRGGVHDHVGAEQRVRPRHLREPLVPARREAEPRVGEVDHREPGVARPEVAILVVARGDRQVDLARARDERAVGRDDDRGVVARRLLRASSARVRTATRARTRRSRAARPAANVWVGPPGSASGSTPAAPGPSGVIAKYGESVSSGRHTSRAPSPAAMRIASASAARCSAAIGVPPLLHERDAERRTRIGGSTRAGDGSTSYAVRSRDRSWRGRHLLGDAVHAAAAVREHRARHRDHLAPGILRADDREHVGVGAGRRSSGRARRR